MYRSRYLSGLSLRAQSFYERYMGEYGDEIAEVADLLSGHEKGLDQVSAI